MDKEIQLDLTNLNSALQSLAELIDVPVLELEIFIYKNLNGDEDLVEKILQRYNVNLNSISIQNLFFKALHVTTSNDKCYEINSKWDATHPTSTPGHNRRCKHPRGQ